MIFIFFLLENKHILILQHNMEEHLHKNKYLLLVCSPQTSDGIFYGNNKTLYQRNSSS